MSTRRDAAECHPPAHLRDPDPRVPDERARLRAAGRAAGGRPATRGPTADTPGRGGVQHLRGAGERRQPAVRQSRAPAAGQEAAPGHADRRRRLPGPEGPAARSSAGRPGSTWSSAPTTSARCRCCWSGPGSQRRPRSRSPKSLRDVPLARCRPGGTRPTPPGSRSASAATTPAPSASCRRCAAGRPTGGPARSWPRSRCWSPRGCRRSPCSGQNVNAYGVGVRRPAGLRQAAPARAASVDGLRTGALHLTAPTGLHRRRDRRHGRDAERDAAAAHAAAVRLGRGAARGCAARTAARATCSIIDNVRAAMPEAAITTDIIVGFPGETEADFQATLDVVAASRFASAFTFQYSIRAGTPAATMPDQVPKAVVQERREGLVRLIWEIFVERPGAGGSHGRGDVRRRGGPQGRRDGALLGSREGQPPRPRRGAPGRGGRLRPRPGDIAEVEGDLRRPAPPDRGPRTAQSLRRRTRGGDAWAARQANPATIAVGSGDADDRGACSLSTGTAGCRTASAV